MTAADLGRPCFFGRAGLVFVVGPGSFCRAGLVLFVGPGLFVCRLGFCLFGLACFLC